MNRLASMLAATALALGLSRPAAAQPAAPAPQGSRTANLQGDVSQQKAMAADVHIHDFYALTRSAFEQGPAKVDVAAYEQKAFAIFRDFGEKTGVGADKMQDHLKLIPRQVVQIVKDDPKVLDSYDNFILALMGPP